MERRRFLKLSMVMGGDYRPWGSAPLRTVTRQRREDSDSDR